MTVMTVMTVMAVMLRGQHHYPHFALMLPRWPRWRTGAPPLLVAWPPAAELATLPPVSRLSSLHLLK